MRAGSRRTSKRPSSTLSFVAALIGSSVGAARHSRGYSRSCVVLDRRSAECYSACPESMHALSTRAVLYQWNLCNSTEDEAAHDKLGYKRSPEALEAYRVARHFELGTHTKAGRAEAFAVRSAWKESIGLHVRY